MADSHHTVFNASDRSYFSLMKKDIHALAVENGFSKKRTAEIDIIIAEMSSNLMKHAGGGEILVKMVTIDDRKALEVICIDNGPGISDVPKMMADGFSSANTLGQGLGAIKRLSDTFQIYTMKAWGTILLSRIYIKAAVAGSKPSPAEIRSLVLCKPGEEVSGDNGYATITADHVKLFLGDGLGHGPEANLAVNEAVKAFRICPDNDPVDIIRFMHTSVKKTRGLVATMALFSLKERKWKISGVGNISLRIHQPSATKNHMTYNGIIGLNIPNTMKPLEVEQLPGQVIILCSDGIKTRWELKKYTDIFKFDLSILAAVIYKDQARLTDDMSIMLCRINRTA